MTVQHTKLWGYSRGSNKKKAYIILGLSQVKQMQPNISRRKKIIKIRGELNKNWEQKDNTKIMQQRAGSLKRLIKWTKFSLDSPIKKSRLKQTKSK